MTDLQAQLDESHEKISAAIDEVAKMQEAVAKLEQELMDFAEDWAMIGIPPRNVAARLMLHKEQRRRERLDARRYQYVRDHFYDLVADHRLMSALASLQVMGQKELVAKQVDNAVDAKMNKLALKKVTP